MICYRDMTFCSAQCATKDCKRQFDAAQKAAAKKWWGGDGAPVAFSDFSNTCPLYEKPQTAGATRLVLSRVTRP